MAVKSDARRSCTFKRPFYSEEEVLGEIKAIVKRGAQARFTGLEPYKCRHCPFWHMGHGRQRKEKR